MERELRAVEWSVQGYGQMEIASRLGISQAAVSKILKRVEARFMREAVAELDRHRARQALRLQHLYSEAVQAWHTSKTERTKRRQRRTSSGPGDDVQVAEFVSEVPTGDPRYLAEARNALRDLRELWGLDAPQQFSIAGGLVSRMTDDQLDRQIAANAKLLEDFGDSGRPERPASPQKEVPVESAKANSGD